MKRLSLLLIIALMLVPLAGCSKGTTDLIRPSDAGITQTVSEGNAGSETGSSVQGAQVIAKSGSSVSNKDKEQILNEINRELDNIIENINNLEDVSDQDLNF